MPDGKRHRPPVVTLLAFTVLMLALLMTLGGCSSSSGGARGTASTSGTYTSSGFATSSAQTTPAQGSQSAAGQTQATDTPDQVIQAFSNELQAGDPKAAESRLQGLTTWGGFGISDMAGLVKFSQVSYKDTANDGNAAVVHYHGYMTYRNKQGRYSTTYAVNGDTTLVRSGSTWKITILPRYLPPDYMGNVRGIN